MKYFAVLRNIFKTNTGNNPDENPDLPVDYKNLYCKPMVIRLL
jgi:hypothetical protein